ncbi:MAG: hypothetical protein AB1481_05090 [Candidatus Omnitrophota bacterium]
MPVQEKEVQEGKFFAAISYITFLCIVSLVLKRENKFALFHAKQGLVLFVFEVVSFILSVIPLLGWFMRSFGFVIFVLVSMWGAFQALMGNYSRLPLVSNIADKVIL